MRKPNTAQRLLIALGVPHQVVLLGHYRDRSRTPTKRGPGRMHSKSKAV